MRTARLYCCFVFAIDDVPADLSIFFFFFAGYLCILCICLCVQIFQLIVVCVYLVALLIRQSMSKGYNLDIGKQCNPNANVWLDHYLNDFRMLNCLGCYESAERKGISKVYKTFA